MALGRWEPFHDVVSLRDAVNSLLQESFVRSGGERAVGPFLPLDVLENDNEFVVKASLPGVAPADVQITVHGDTVSIRGETKAEEEKQGQNWLLRERRQGSFQRAFAVTAPIDSEKARAQFEHGVLTLTLPKAEAAKPKQIKINTGA
jgi:HSP20 family protein